MEQHNVCRINEWQAKILSKDLAGKPLTLLTTYSGEKDLMFEANFSNSSATGHATPSSSAISTKRASMSASKEVQST